MEVERLTGLVLEGQARGGPCLPRGEVLISDLAVEPMQRLEAPLDPEDAQHEAEAHGEAVVHQQRGALHARGRRGALRKAVAAQQQRILKGS